MKSPTPQPRTIAETLERTLELLATPEQWTWGTNARDRRGNPVLACSRRACRRCLYGALWAATGGLGFELFDRAVSFLNERLNWKPLASFNDRAGYAAVIRFLREALADAQALGV